MNVIAENDKRVDQRITLDILLNKYIQGRPYICRASNLSRRGILIHQVHEPRSQETHVGLQFQLPGVERVITCAGQVIYTNGEQGSGIQFTCIDPEHQQLIENFIEGHIDDFLDE
jgi:hypothetical protein